MIKMMYRYRYKLYYKRPNYIVLITDKNIMTRDDLYAYNFFFIQILGEPFKSYQFPRSSTSKNTKIISEMPFIILYRCVYFSAFTSILKNIIVQTNRQNRFLNNIIRSQHKIKCSYMQKFYSILFLNTILYKYFKM